MNESSRKYIPPKSRKFRWFDGYGRQLTAGGILPYDDIGIWVIGEENKNNIVYTDIGGKYQYQDGDIFKTIAREFGEEVYHSSDLSRQQVLDIANKFTPVYINGHRHKPVYVCYIVPNEYLTSINVCLSPERFLEERQKVLIHNPIVPAEYYNSVILRRMPYSELKNMLHTDNGALSYRLKGILKYGSLSDKLEPSPINNVTQMFGRQRLSNST